MDVKLTSGGIPFDFGKDIMELDVNVDLSLLFVIALWCFAP